MIRRHLRERDAGVHVKTAGTTWLAEVEGLARAGGDALKLAKSLYADMRGRIDELSKPYATVIDIDRSRLPSPAEVKDWTGERFASALSHNQSERLFNPHFRQLVHVGFRVAAERSQEYLAALDAHRRVIGPIVTENLFARHIAPLFLED